MKLSITLLILCISFQSLMAQQLSTARRSSPVLRVYEISALQAKDILRGKEHLEDDYFTHLYGMYATDSLPESENLPVGHYIFVKAVNENLTIWLESHNNLSLNVLNNQRDLVMIFSSTDGKEIRPGKVRLGKRTIRWDVPTHTFRKKKARTEGILEVEFNQHTSFFFLDKYPDRPALRQIGKRILYTFPINLVTNSVNYLVHNVPSLFNSGYMNTPGIASRFHRLFGQASNYSGYMVTNKPTYRPRDTVRLKAIVLNKRGKIQHQKLELYLYGSEKPKLLSSLSPSDNGSYLFDFVLADSLGLRLDDRYRLQLEDKRGKIILSGFFTYEDYDLKANHFSVRSINENKRAPGVLEFSGRNSNGMPLYDVSIDITLTTDVPGSFSGDSLHLAQTLWKHTMPLEKGPVTRLVLPDSLFPRADFTYHAQVVFLDAQNEIHEFNKVLYYRYDAFPVKVSLKEDMLSFISQRENDDKCYEVSVSNAAGETRTETGILPFLMKVTPFDVEVVARQGNQSHHWQMNEFDPEVQFHGERTADSVSFSASSPAGVVIRYFVFCRNRLLTTGQGTAVNYSTDARWNADYSVSAQYVWAGAPVSKEFSLALTRNDLKISTDNKSTVYPGAREQMKVHVSDTRGDPVEGVNLTAWAITEKFDEHLQQIYLPSFEKRFHTRKALGTYSRVELQGKIIHKLDWELWKDRLGLDSLEFYQFLFPKGGIFKELRPSTTSTVLPFVVDSTGSVLPVHYLYVDGQVVYSSQTSHMQPYAFRIDPGYRTFTFRGADFELSLPPMYIHDSTRLIFSVNRDYPEYRNALQEKSIILDMKEIRSLRSHFVEVEPSPEKRTQVFEQNERYFPIPKNSNTFFVGPFQPGNLTILDDQGTEQRLSYEPFYSYEYTKRLLKLRTMNPDQNLRRHPLSLVPISPNFNDQPWNAQDVRTYFTMGNRTHRHSKRPSRIPRSDKGRLLIELSEDVRPVTYFILNLNRPDQFYILDAERPDNYLFDASTYEVVAIYADSSYSRISEARVQAGYWNKFRFSKEVVPPDSFSRTLLQKISLWQLSSNYIQMAREQDYQSIRQEYVANHRPNPYSTTVKGYVRDMESQPLPGVNVILKGTSLGTITDLNGYYEFNAPGAGTLVFSFIGYQTTEESIGGRQIVSVQMLEDVTQLSEVVVVGYGMSIKRDLTGTVSSTNNLQGRVAGIEISKDKGGNIQIRGMSSLNGSDQPLLIVDGVIVSSLDQLDESEVKVIELLKPEMSSTLYGARGANGVLLISTREGVTLEDMKEKASDLLTVRLPEQSEENSIRHNFRDYAFWNPDLRTDHQGNAQFEVTYPDDITGWRMQILGIGKKKSGSLTTSIKSFKPLLGELLAPRFLVAGDSAQVVGRVTNYSSDSLGISYGFTRMHEENIGSSRVMYQYVHPLETDSLRLEFIVKRNNYTDGERRIIPVLPQGVEETTGDFYALPSDTIMHLKRISSNWKISIKSDLLQVILEESRYLADYVHGCNEQMASRLAGLLMESRIQAYLGVEKRSTENEIEHLIRLLSGHQLSGGGWAWWGDSGKPADWVTIHILKSLQQAQEAGFTVAWDEQGATNYLSTRLVRMNGTVLYHTLEWMSKSNHLIYLDSLQGLTDPSDTLFVDVLWRQRLRQLQGLSVDWPEINRHRHLTIYGNSYYGPNRTGLFTNELQSTLMVYRMLEAENKQTPELARIRGYLMEKRKNHWLNTYESATILNTIVDGLMAQHSNFKPVKLTVNDKEIKNLPVILEPSEDQLTIRKTGSATVYLASMSTDWNSTPAPVDSLFKMQTYFSDGQGRLEKLQEGDPVELVVNLEAKKEGEYMMLTVPIPSGTKYAHKRQVHDGYVVHREYFTDHVNLYFEALPAGRYSFAIGLIPSFSGKYVLNPAKMESMYFPMFYGRNGVEQFTISN